MKNKRFKIGIGVLFFVIGIPIIINELYKREGWYSTVWTGADTLAYWGTLLGAAATILALVGTIEFTKRQIKAEKIRESQRDEWKEIEKNVDDILFEFYPMKVYEYVVSALDRARKRESKTTVLFEFYKYNARMMYLLDRFSMRRYEKHSSFFSHLAKEMLYMSTQLRTCTEFITKTYDVVEKYSKDSRKRKSVSDELPEIKALEKEKMEILEMIMKHNKEEYSSLMREKQEVFRDIYKSIDEKTVQLIDII